ncbi:OB-fold domain-containing protein [bacterium]|nr:OB-fold domain-containing protein [bacterium]
MTHSNPFSLPVKEGLWTDPATSYGESRLIASQCKKCEEIFFPKQVNGICSNCQNNDLDEILLSTTGKIYSYSVVMQRPPFYYQGEVPYALGFVELPEGIRVETLFTDCDFDDLKIGMDVKMIIERLHGDDAGNEVICYKFKPLK